jgi:hypothetical protein
LTSIRQVLAGDPSEEVRADALAALGELGDGRAVPALVRALYEDPHWMCQLQARLPPTHTHTAAAGM